MTNTERRLMTLTSAQLIAFREWCLATGKRAMVALINAELETR